MAYFAQAGGGQFYDQSGVQESDDTAQAEYQQFQTAQPQGATVVHPFDPQLAGSGAYSPTHTEAPVEAEPQPFPETDAYAYGGQAAAFAAPDAAYGGHDVPQFAQEEPEDYAYDDGGYQPQAAAARPGLTRTLSLLGAAASLALVVGVGYWGYNLVMRDVSGVPVVRAIEGPMRVQPADPGGQPADHQGLAVNAVAATGTAEKPADSLTLAPQPMELAEDDQPLSGLQQPVAEIAPEVADDGVTQDSVAEYQNGNIDALVAELTKGVEPLSQNAEEAPLPTSAPVPAIVAPEPLKPVEIAAVAPVPSKLLNAPGVKISLRPNVRPARFAPAKTPTSTSGSAAVLEVSADTLPAGTRLAQLGAYESAEVARAEWDRIHSKFGDYLEGKKRVIQRAESGGRTFYRLRAMGFEGLSDARRFCSALVAGKADCIPVTTR